MANGKEERQSRILVVDDDRATRESMEEILEDDYDVVCVADGPSALEKIQKEVFDLVFLDVVMPEMDGIETLRRIKAFDNSLDVIMVSATDRAREATDSIKSGAYDYITKPFDAEVVLHHLENALHKRSLEQEIRYLRSEMALRAGDTRVISQSDSMKAVFRLVGKVAQAASNVLISGESGTGKELIARVIHNGSPRAEHRFVAINCAAIPPELIEAELFGHEKGAFTGAYRQNIGKFEFANRGTIFLDEISSLKLEMQAKLLRFLQEREFTRVGSNRSIKVDIRMVAATNTRLEEMIADGRFRDDLYFRLNVIPIQLPPLRQRKGDIPLLANYFLERFNRRLNKNIRSIEADAMAVLEAYPWPGNIRELENLIERMVVLEADGKAIDEKALPFDLLFHDEASEEDWQGKTVNRGLIEARRAFERQYVLRALRSCGWNQAETARMLKIHRNTLVQKIKSLKIRRGD
ncbi:MAG: sigma-54 dependent transcriptional regulator [Desulfobacteraceae bacterium]|nr:sigma-54 dependent transcriptional regulator [Desulfobacteraceae bacterium]